MFLVGRPRSVVTLPGHVRSPAGQQTAGHIPASTICRFFQPDCLPREPKLLVRKILPASAQCEVIQFSEREGARG
jgi:hypothetical protein